jgi:hypothetical protein
MTPSVNEGVETPTSISESISATSTPTIAIEATEELRGILNGNLASGDANLYKGYVYAEMDGIVYCTTLEGDIVQTIYQGCISNINVYKDKVYLAADYDAEGLFRCNLDGSNLEVISQQKLCNVIVYDNKIYAISEGDWKLVRFNLDGSNWEELESCFCFIIEEAKVYYIGYEIGEFNGICSMNLDGTDKRELFKTDYGYNLNYSDGWIYFNNEDAICRIMEDGTDYTRVREGSAWRVNLDGEYIYFIDPTSMYELIRMKKDGSEEETISYWEINEYSILGDFIRYNGINDNHATHQIRKDGSERIVINE